MPSLARAQTRWGGGSRARRHALLHSGGFGESEALVRKTGPARAVGGEALPRQDAARERSAWLSARILRHHDDQATPGGELRASPRRCAAAHRSFPAAGAGRAAAA